jgi:hypothetical protein
MHAEAAPATVQGITPNVDLTTLRAIVADLQAAHPAAGSRVEKGAALFLFRHVERSASGAWYVQSETDADVEYILAGDQCTCQDFSRHGDQSPCKHQFCRAIYQRAERLEADANSPIEWELTPAAEVALAALGEPCDTPRWTPPGLTGTALEAYRELYGEDPPPAA